MAHIFVSYSRKDIAVVSEVVDSLKKSGLDVWQDISGKGTGIPFSTKWFEVIEDALYTSSGAVIFKSEAWEKSNPCAKEFALIDKNAIPFIEVDASDSAENIAMQILPWFSDAVETETNQSRTELFSRAYRYKKNKRGYHLVPKVKKIIDAFEYLLELRDLRKQITDEGYADKNPEITKSMFAYLRFMKRRILMRQLTKIFGLLVAASAIVIVYVGARVLPIVFAETTLDNQMRARFSEAYRIGKNDPIAAMSVLRSSSLIDPGKSAALFSMHRLMLKLEKTNFPVAFFPQGSSEAADYKNRAAVKPNDRYEITLSGISGQIVVRDKTTDTLKTVMLPCVPSEYAFSEDSSCFAVSAANRVYVMDLANGFAPAELSYNFEDVGEIGFDGNRVYIVTVKGNAVVWNNPIRAVVNNRKNRNDGLIYAGGDGQPVAIYFDGNDFIINRGNTETIIPIMVDGVISAQHIALSNDRQLCAFSYMPDDTDLSRVLIIDLEAREVVADYSAEADIVGLAFSQNDKAIAAACFDGRGVVRIDVENGNTVFSKPADDQFYGIAAYSGGYLLTDYYGWMVMYDANLNQVSDWFNISGFVSAPMKQVAVSEKYGVVFTANRGGNRVGGCVRTSLSGYGQNIFFLMADDTVSSNTSVAVSSDGEFVAYGYPNGQICVWESKEMWVSWYDQSIPESITALAISPDNMLIYALGASGTVYTLETGGLSLVPEEAEQRQAYWQTYSDRAYETGSLMYDLKLTCIHPE